MKSHGRRKGKGGGVERYHPRTRTAGYGHVYQGRFKSLEEKPTVGFGEMAEEGG
jgi:hypothetical protein